MKPSRNGLHATKARNQERREAKAAERRRQHQDKYAAKARRDGGAA